MDRIMGTFDLVVLEVILESLCALVSNGLHLGNG